MKLVSRTVLASVNALFFSAIVALFLLATTQTAWAYVDPSVMTYTIQALAGVAIALSALLGVVWRRIRRILLRVLHIDENSGKVSESTIHEIDVDAPDAPQKLAEAQKQAQQAHQQLAHPAPEHLRLRARIVFALLVSLFFVFTVLIDPPLEMVSSNANSLIFSFNDIFIPLLISSAIVLIVMTLVLCLLRGRVFNVALALVTAFALAVFVQENFLNQGLPAADGRPLDWSVYSTITFISAVVWIALFAISIFFSLHKSLLFKGVACAGSLVLVLTQAAGLFVLNRHTSDFVSTSSANPVVTTQGLFEVSDKHNVVVFVLDTFDTKYFQNVLQDYPEVNQEFSDFTFYPNSVGSMIPTRYGIPSLLTGKDLVSPEDQAFSNTVIHERVADHNLLDDLNALDYSVGVYTTDMTPYLDVLSPKTKNIHPIADRSIDRTHAGAYLVKFSLYRSLPWLFKPAFRFYTDDMNNAVVQNAHDVKSSSYTSDDPAFYSDLKQQRLSIHDEGTGSFRFIHLVGAHYPFMMDEHGQRLSEEGTQEAQCRGALRIVKEYIDQLKELDVYNQTSIIMTADHGEWYLTDGDIEKPTAPFLVVKPAGTSTGASLLTSDTPTGHLDVAATILSEAGGDPSSYGRSVFDEAIPDRKRYYWATSSNGTEDTYIRLWEIDGNATDWSKWHRLPRELPVKQVD